MTKLRKKKRTEIDKIIKNYIWKIRLSRDKLYKDGVLPEESVVETTNYRP